MVLWRSSFVEGSRSYYNLGISFILFISLYGTHDLKVVPQFPPSLAALTVTLVGSWWPTILWFYLTFNKASGFPLLSPRAAFLLETELPALKNHFNIWVWLLLGQLWREPRTLVLDYHSWPHLNALNKKINALWLVRVRLNGFHQYQWVYRFKLQV